MVNHLAVWVTALVAMAIGYLWYSPKLFGPMWMKLSGIKMKKKPEGMWKTFVAGLISNAVLAYVLALVLKVMEAETIGHGIFTGLLMWLGFMATISLGMVLWEKKPFKLYILNNAHNLIMMAVMGALLAVWV